MTVCNKPFDRESHPRVPFPTIQLCSKWLKDNGFMAVHTIDITYEDGKTIITKSQVERFVIE